MTQAQIEERKQLLEVAQEAEKYYQSNQIQSLKKVMDDLERELNPDFSLNDNIIQNSPPLTPKKRVRRNRMSNYSPTKVKVQNFLTNISSNRVKDEDFNNKLFLADCCAFVLLYLNPFYHERKFEAESLIESESTSR